MTQLFAAGIKSHVPAKNASTQSVFPMLDFAPMQQATTRSSEQSKPANTISKTGRRFSVVIVTSISAETDIGADASPTESQSPFEELDALRMNGLQHRIDQIRLSSTLSYRDRFVARIKALLNAYAEENEGRAFSSDSLRALVNFLEENSGFNYPDLTLTPSGNMYAQWKSGKNKLLSIHFLPTSDTRFVIFKPNPKHKDRIIRISGSTTVDALLETIAPHGVMEWASL
jgi:hypothetical protein